MLYKDREKFEQKYGQPEYEVPDNKTERGRNMQRGQGYGMNSIFTESALENIRTGTWSRRKSS